MVLTQHTSEEVQGSQEVEGMAVDEDVIDWQHGEEHEIVIDDPLSSGAQARQDAETEIENEQVS